MLIVCLFGATTIASSTPKPPTVTRPWADVVCGKYDGKVLDGGRFVAQTIRLQRDPAGRLVGTYTVAHDDDEYEGQLINATYQAPTTVTFVWKDRHGEGVISLVFTPDGQAFKGAWGAAAIDPANQVDGHRSATR